MILSMGQPMGALPATGVGFGRLCVCCCKGGARLLVTTCCFWALCYALHTLQVVVPVMLVSVEQNKPCPQSSGS